MPSEPIVGTLASSPAADAALGEEQGSLAWVFGFRVHSGGELIAELSSGHAAPYRARKAGGVVLLEGSSSFAVANNYLFIGSSAAALERLAGFTSLSAVPAHAARSSEPDLNVQLAKQAGALIADWVSAGGLGRLLHGLFVVRSGGVAGPAPGSWMGAAFRSRCAAFAQSINGGALSVQLRNGEVQLAASLHAAPPFTVRSDACAVLRQLPRAAGAYLALADLGWSAQDLYSALTVEQAGSDREELMAVLSEVRGPLLLGIEKDERLRFFASYRQLGGEKSLRRMLKLLTRSKQMQSWLPQQLSGTKLFERKNDKGVAGGLLIAPGQAAPKAELSWAMLGSQAWTVLSSDAVTRLSQHMQEVTRRAADPVMAQRTRCEDGTFLATELPLDGGRLSVQLLKSSDATLARAQAPLSLPLSYWQVSP